MLPHYQQRWLCDDLPSLADRVAAAIGTTDEERRTYKDLISSSIFIPAGNTLLVGAPGVSGISPNCCVLGTLTDDTFDDILALSKKLWASRTGIGFDLSGLKDPVGGLVALSKANAAIILGHRPNRGNMASLKASHPRINEFIACKDVVDVHNFNISVAFEGEPDPDLIAKISEHAWKTGDPGVIFLDRASSYGPSIPPQGTVLDPIVTCVPCGEQFMHAYETCTLGAINLASFALVGTGAFRKTIDLDELAKVVGQAVTFLDSVIDHLSYPDETIKKVSLGARRIGLGVMGWADYLERNDIPYDSPEALEIASTLAHLISSAAERRSRELAIEKGSCEYAPGYRNLSMTCIAPTGGITYLTGNKGYAIEPFFEHALSYPYNVHVDMAVAWQSGIHNAVSKTINLPHSSTPEDIAKAYTYAYLKGAKGVSVYRDGCRTSQPKCLGCVE
jgi:ribonucleoside-diphosphate reductase alpha chain